MVQGSIKYEYDIATLTEYFKYIIIYIEYVMANAIQRTIYHGMILIQIFSACTFHTDACFLFSMEKHFIYFHEN